MPVVVIQVAATGYSVVVPRQENGTTTTTASTKEAPNPILPVGSEMAWGLGSFLVLVLLMRVWLFPKLKKGMDARYAKTRGDLDDAERIRAAAAEDVARYEAAIAEVNAEAARLLERPARSVDADRTAKIDRRQRPHRRAPGRGRGRDRRRPPHGAGQHRADRAGDRRVGRRAHPRRAGRPGRASRPSWPRSSKPGR